MSPTLAYFIFDEPEQLPIRLTPETAGKPSEVRRWQWFAAMSRA
jgi:hypothetical protein